MNNMRISLFGGVRIEGGMLPTQTRITTTISNLLAYLILYRQRAHPRDVLASLLWSDYPQERARACLNTAVWRLRQVLEPPGSQKGGYLQTTSMGELSFNFQPDLWVDVAEFEKQVLVCRHLAPADASQQVLDGLEKAIELYTGDLLEGCYCDWALRERERLRQHYIDALYFLMRAYQSKQFAEKSIDWGQIILQADPLREDVHRQLMRLYLENSQRALAVQQFHRCRAFLLNELGIEPMPETQQLFEQALLSPEYELPKNATKNLEIREAIQRLQQAIDVVNRAQKDLQLALEQLH